MANTPTKKDKAQDQSHTDDPSHAPESGQPSGGRQATPDADDQPQDRKAPPSSEL